MLEKLNSEGLEILSNIVNAVGRKRKKSFFHHFIVKIIDNSTDTTKSLRSIAYIIQCYGYDEDLAIEKLAFLYEQENNNKLDNLCNFYNN